jgi:hypothetical protein
MAVNQNPRTLPVPGRIEIEPADTTNQRLRNHLGNAYRRLTERPLSLYAAAFLRIGFGLLYLVLLVREFPHRQELWGPESPWTPALARQSFAQSGWVSLLTLSDSQLYFEACYAVALLAALLFMLGWHTRAASILFAVMVASIRGRNMTIVDGGDNLTFLMVVYLIFTACGRRWSLDSRRARRRAAIRLPDASRPTGEEALTLRAQAGVARDFTATVLHNCAMLVIMAQLCILYGATSLYKVQGEMWDDGTAIHYVLNLDGFQPWPALSHLIDSHQLVVTVLSYLTVLVQVALPFSVFSNVKYVVLAFLIPMHLGIAVVLGLPLFSAVMIVADAAFLPDRFYQAVARIGRRALRARRGGPALDTP